MTYEDLQIIAVAGPLIGFAFGVIFAIAAVGWPPGSV